MTAITVQNGSLVLRDGKVGTGQDCCCDAVVCGIDDGKDRTDPQDEGTWVPSGTWVGGGVSWTFTANPGDDSGETWFFYGSASTSKTGGGASESEQQDWQNICNWYSNKTTAPDQIVSTSLNKRATRLPPSSAVVHIYTSVNTNGSKTVKHAYFWQSSVLVSSSDLTTTAAAHDSSYGAVLSDSSSVASGATINAGGLFLDSTENGGTVNGGGTFRFQSENSTGATVNDGGVFTGDAANLGTVNGGATFTDVAGGNAAGNAGTVNGGGTFNNNSINFGTVNNSGSFVDSTNSGTVNGGATFSDGINNGTVNGGATFNNTSINSITGTVNDGATFNDASCSTRTIGSFFATPCTRIFVAHPSDLPTCNGTAPDGCASSVDACGCG